MNLTQKIAARWRDLFRKHRFAMLDATGRNEEWHLHLSPAGIFAAAVALVLLLGSAILLLTAYTPLPELLPGYRTEADRSRESLVRNIGRLDSLEGILSDMMTYNRNIALIMEGKTPVARTIETAAGDTLRGTKVLVMPSAEDSLLRAQMEGDGPYALRGGAGGSARRMREALELAAPVEGMLTQRFDLRDGMLGVRIAAAAAARITAVGGGTVVQSLWTPEYGYAVTIQHPDNLLSIYRGLSQSLVTAGQAVRGGDQIGYHAEEVEGEVRPFEFELWNGGKPVDPEGYILF